MLGSMMTCAERTQELNSTEACMASGLSSRQLHYIVDNDIVTPAVRGVGSGNPHRWEVRQMKVLRAVAVLLDHGARHETLRPAARHLALLREDAWTARVLVTHTGRITTLLGADSNGWVLDLSLCRDRIDAAA